MVVDGKVTPKKVLRYIYANEGVKFHKYTPSMDRTSIVGKGRDLKMVDVLSDIDKSELDLDSYISDAKEMILDMLLKRKSKCIPNEILDDIEGSFAKLEEENATKI